MAKMDDLSEQPTASSVAERAPSRLAAMRVPFAAILVAGLLLWLGADVPLAVCVPPLALVLLAVWYAAIRSGRETSRPAGLARRSGPWPDSGLKAVAGALGTASILTDGGGVVRYLNSEAASQFPLMKPGDPLSFGLRVPAVLDALDRLVESGEAERVEWTQRIPAERWLEIRLSAIAYPPRAGGQRRRPDYVLIVIDDLTEQRRVERMRADFVANASHELRTPLASLSGFIETLQGAAKDDVVARGRFLGIMAEQAARMKRLIDDLLSLSRIEMKAHMQPDTVLDLRDVVTRAGDALAPLAREGGIALDIRLPEARLAVRGEADELAQVLSNLIENALKYGADGKTVEVTAGTRTSEEGEPAAFVTVSDHGPGIAAEHLPRLTERFYRVDVATSRAKQGTGLGLAIVKHIVTRHRGRLAVASVPGEGASFTVILPLA